MMILSKRYSFALILISSSTSLSYSFLITPQATKLAQVPRPHSHRVATATATTLNYANDKIDYNGYNGDDENTLKTMYVSNFDSKNERGYKGSIDKTTKKQQVGGLYSLSVTELKRLLSERDIDYRDCLEKRDLVERLENSANYLNYKSREKHHKIGGEDSLSDHERSLVSTFKRVSPSVANIKTSIEQPQQGIFGYGGGLSLQGTEIPLGSGSGFLWDDKGHVVTNYHVIAASVEQQQQQRSSIVTVKLAGMADALEVEIVGVEPEKDLAVLRIKSSRQKLRLPRPIDVGTSVDLQVGQSVMAIGNPFGLDDTLTTGIVSAIGRDVNGYGGRPIHGCIQTDAAINPGNSGGPLLDSRGRLIGVNTIIYSPGGSPGNVGIGFAIPVDTVRRVVNQIIRYGKIVRPSIGINILNDRLVKYIDQQLPDRTLDGCLIAGVVPNSPALSANLQPTTQNSAGSLVLGDLITAVNRKPIRESEELISEIEEKDDQEVVTLTVLRKCDPNRKENVRINLTTRDKLEHNQQQQRKRNYSIWE